MMKEIISIVADVDENQMVDVGVRFSEDVPDLAGKMGIPPGHLLAMAISGAIRILAERENEKIEDVLGSIVDFTYTINVHNDSIGSASTTDG